jgi:quercetin dioxygenase-like cupin family protein
MTISRRDLALLAPAVMAAQPQKAAKPTLPSKVYLYDQLPVKESNGNRQRAVLDGLTHGGFAVELHMTELGPGLAPHAAHRHSHEEIVMIRRGELEVTIEGRVSRVTAGSVVCVASNELHGWKNPGTVPAEYFVIALGKEA